jgi:hypothetical protein
MTLGNYQLIAHFSVRGKFHSRGDYRENINYGERRSDV